MQTTRIFTAAAAIAASLCLSSASVHVHAQQAAKTGGPIHVATFVDLMPPSVPAGTKAVQQYVADTKNDAGIVRIDAMAQVGRENHLVIYEVWQSQEAFDAHEALAHTRAFKTTLYPLMGAPFDQREHHPI